MSNTEKCTSCFACSEVVTVQIRDDRGSPWRDSTVRRCANNDCWRIVEGTREDRLKWISNVYDYKYFGDYALSEEQLAAVYEAKSLAGSSVDMKALGWRKDAGKPNDLYVVASSVVGTYRISPMGREGFELRLFCADQFPIFVGMEDAKAGAQSDYEARIRSALA